LGQTKYYKISIGCFSAKLLVLRRDMTEFLTLRPPTGY
jgi:hypothetical protein